MAEAEEQVKATAAGQGKEREKEGVVARPWKGARGGAELREGAAGRAGGRAAKGRGSRDAAGRLFLDGTWGSRRHAPRVGELALPGSAPRACAPGLTAHGRRDG